MIRVEQLVGDILKRAELCEFWVTEGKAIYDDPGPRGIERRFAMRMAFIEIAEAANRLPENFRVEHPEIPWAEIRGMRNIVAHGYDRVNDRTLWRAIAGGLPQVAVDLRVALDARGA